MIFKKRGLSYDKARRGIREVFKVKKTAYLLLILICAAAVICALPSCSKEKEQLSNYDIFAIYDEKTQTLTGTVDFEFYNSTGNEIGDLKFNLFGNAFRKEAKRSPVSDTYKQRAYYAGESWGGMEVSNVENCKGWNVAGEDENILVVNLPTPVYPEERTTIKISYTLTLAKVNHRTGVTADVVNLGNFYPLLCAYSTEGFIESPYYYCGDPFLSECANYKVTIDLPPEYIAASSGKLISESTANDRKKCAYTLNGARDFALALSDKFEVISENADGVAVSYYYVKDNEAQRSLAAAVESLKYFNGEFGKYSYPTLSVVQTGFCYGGMEYPALTMVSQGLDFDNNIYTIVHENAHQWWYAMVGSDQLNNAWQDEGLAEYSTLMFFESHPSYGFTRTGMLNSAKSYYRAFFNVFEQLNGKVNTAMRRNLGEYSGELEYNNITYNKGMILFEYLRNFLGDDKFKSALKDYFKENTGKIASYENLYASFMKYGDLQGVFDSFVEGKILI